MGWKDRYTPSQEGYKVCSKCLEEKPLTTEYWNRNSQRKNGFNGFCKLCMRKAKNSYCAVPENRLRRNLQAAEYRRLMRYEVLCHYSDDPPKCTCEGCDVTEIEWLTIDHIDGGGTKHKTTFHGPLDRWLYNNNLPEGFRVLCMNCNHALGQYGYCPHQRKGVSTNGNV